jgi:hypothetical protein
MKVAKEVDKWKEVVTSIVSVAQQQWEEKESTAHAKREARREWEAQRAEAQRETAREREVRSDRDAVQRMRQHGFTEAVVHTPVRQQWVETPKERTAQRVQFREELGHVSGVELAMVQETVDDARCDNPAPSKRRLRPQEEKSTRKSERIRDQSKRAPPVRRSKRIKEYQQTR